MISRKKKQTSSFPFFPLDEATEVGTMVVDVSTEDDEIWSDDVEVGTSDEEVEVGTSDEEVEVDDEEVNTFPGEIWTDDEDVDTGADEVVIADEDVCTDDDVDNI